MCLSRTKRERRGFLDAGSARWTSAAICKSNCSIATMVAGLGVRAGRVSVFEYLLEFDRNHIKKLSSDTFLRQIRRFSMSKSLFDIKNTIGYRWYIASLGLSLVKFVPSLTV